MEQYILKIATNDAKGLIYNISKVLFANNLNIDTNAEYVDPQTKNFFMRSLISGNVSSNILLKELKEVLPQGSQITLNKRTKKDVVLLATKEAHVLGDLLIKYISNELNANIKAVIANHEDLRNLVEKFDIPFFCISADNLSKEQHEELLKAKIDEFNPELIVLAKYMRILTPNFVEKYKGKVLNIHHSFLPAFIGANPYKQAFDRGVKIIGATAHFVTNDLDEGPIIYQDVVRVDHTYSWEDMRNAGRDVEKVVLSNAFELLLEDRVFVFKNKTVIL
ncbi:formyltetrahydrofolate deformylase [Aliarcobacter skirrowii]|uniref:Formyltetrahydrofolate deformylase n=1 Tax=Aliarcobacter skirrowii CCUG 10374 TaxID=1032239 RepID=A0AAD0WNT1_9BACT|nr:formyltetrahydrofolate deformylase [Aliarcobacter skirrowii]AXX85076.1 formyltetrahydrofolate deformylase [Aliarcobacter skirrowii CCUG 10374]KAB0620763.1 formyltetrahydrofolate deformylase [Aliarcobacter skirrowii CCUG 10374]MDX4012161.1 formyltetrahydrofolate deformylase [Aliarcobacter skirrowii]MDX4038311.1 formyltetrahydrofolate deformylase [Aliarcobacter skirrowii]RXI26049.1 formyltetrahydrofolate deformylase [Aliarcobacter skirrowii CCUG 10374]